MSDNYSAIRSLRHNTHISYKLNSIGDDRDFYEETYENTPIQVALFSVFKTAYYWYLSTKIKVVSS